MSDTATATAPKGKRGEAPFTVEYLNDKAEVSSRVPDNVKGLRITDKGSKNAKDYFFADFPDNVIIGLAAAGYNRAFQTAIRNSLGDDGDVDVVGIADKIQGHLASGKLYARTGQGKGKISKKAVFDTEFWSEVGSKFFASQSKDKTVDPVKLEKFLAKMESFDPRSRESKASKHPAMKAALQSVKAARAVQDARKSAQSGKTMSDDLDEIFADDEAAAA